MAVSKTRAFGIHCSLLNGQPGIKVDGRYYQDVLLKQEMQLIARIDVTEDSAPAQGARDNVQLLHGQTEITEFVITYIIKLSLRFLCLWMQAK